MFVYVGTYTKDGYGDAEGIYVYRFDPASGGLTLVQTVDGVTNPSFLTLAASGDFLYADNELAEGRASAFARDPKSGTLRFLNTHPSHGADPCYISLDPSGRFALVTNYSGGTLAVFPIAADGSLEAASHVVPHDGSGPNPQRQEGPHPHMIAPSPDGSFIIATDLGTDSIYLYRLDPNTGRLTPGGGRPGKAPAGGGPRHFGFSPDAKTLYGLNELGSSVTVYAYDADSGSLQAGQTVSSLPDGFTGENTCAQLVVAPDGRFVYASNRGHDSIAVWPVRPDGSLGPATQTPSGGKTPRNFNIDPSGAWLLAANQESGNLVSFRRDPATGALTQITETASPSPVCVIFREE